MRWENNDIFKRSVISEFFVKISPTMVVIALGIYIFYYAYQVNYFETFDIFLSGVIILLCFTFFYYFIIWRSTKRNPKKIRWDQDGIYWIDFSGKNHQIGWNQIHSLFEYQDSLRPSKDYETYILKYKSGSFFSLKGVRVKKRIGKRLEEYYGKMK